MTADASTASHADPACEVGVLLDNAALGRAHLRIIGLAMLAIVLDGFDLQALGFAAPALIADWGISRGALAPLFAAGIIGMALGAILIGPRGDLWGRRKALIASVLLFALATGACAVATTTTELLVYRLLAGIGLGGALPNATALVAETAPLRWRALLTSALLVGVPVGGVIGGELAARLLPVFGWRSIFVVGGAAPLLLAGALWLWLPESARLQLRTGRTDANTLAWLNRLQSARRFAVGDPVWLHEPAGPGHTALRHLFSDKLLRDTVGLWLLFLGNMFAVFCFMNWMPAVLVGLGHGIDAASRLLALFNLGGVAGALGAAWLMRYYGSRPVLTVLATVAIANSVAMSVADLSVWRNVLMLSVIAGACINSLMVGTYVLSAHVYPTEIRATGVGAAIGVGRSGAVLSSFAGALVGGGAAGASQLFLLVGAVMMLSLISIAMVRRHLPPHR